MFSTLAPVLELRDLAVEFATREGAVVAVAGVTLTVLPGECVGLVGESGAGKSQTLLAPFRLSASTARITGVARAAGEDLLALDERALDAIRGKRVGFVFQNPMSFLTPHRTIGEQLVEVLECHGYARGAPARARARALLERVRIDEPVRRFGQYPHELSGGQRQRALIAIAIACDPWLLIADEPTTALDVTVQADILALLASLKAELRLAIVLVSHDFGVVSRLADRIHVMYAGRIVEEGTTAAVIAGPKHPYTAALLACIPRMDDPQDSPLRPIPGQPPEVRSLPTGCAFHPRCAYAEARCRAESPGLAHDGARAVACHFPLPA